MLAVGSFIATDERAPLHWGYPEVAAMPVGSSVVTTMGVEWTKTDWGWLSQYGVEVRQSRLWRPARINRLVEQPVDRLRPPGHTCPKIDHLIGCLRKIEWWEKNRPENTEKLKDLIREAITTANHIREENSMMRDAYYDMLKRTKG